MAGNPSVSGAAGPSTAAPVAPIVRLLPSAAQPLLSGVRAKMLRALDDDDSYLTLMRVLPGLVESLDRQSLESGKTVDAFKHDRGVRMNSLLHCIPRDLLRHVVAGTVAYAFHNANTPSCETYSADYCGTYVCSISIRGRDGAFLTNNEISSLCGHILHYKNAWLRYLADGSVWTVANAAEQRFVKEVDSQYRTVTASEPPVWCKTSRAPDMLEHLRNMFLRRMNPILDPGGTVAHEQSPIMVGCSSGPIAERVRYHIPASGMTQSNYTWALTLSLIKYMGLDPLVVTVPLIGTYQQWQLPYSEMLGTTLAQSLLTQEGYNSVQGGGQTDPLARGEEEVVVCARRDILDSNVTATLKAIAHLRKLIKVNNQDLDEDINKEIEAFGDLEQVLREACKYAAGYQADRKAMESKSRELDTQVAKGRDVIRGLQGLRTLREKLQRKD